MTLPRPTEGELAILRVLWQSDGPCTVHQVHEVLSQAKDTAYTTVLKMLSIMAEKGLVTRDDSDRRHRYSAAQPEPEVQAVLLKDLMQRAFSGSALQLVQRALDVDKASASELDAIARVIAEAKARQRKST
ncbi:BlaI/MecI/CopY family transcriptional regulator [Ideonella azotifigens]|uniref:BlaI/MecI/CopY family transcriptional regulator n=1 Tax=Ideonella azotifigens TaxID=513160 RepID=A0ABN1K591_9BURK|nr:BlaI/MecI/CopY family transcriptional regulator [Ideonella azotifigens]MCD2344386.1 BlaI/MecI/CopY family transcriptional regulator [Ideonella azotifigens]